MAGPDMTSFVSNEQLLLDENAAMPANQYNMVHFHPVQRVPNF